MPSSGGLVITSDTLTPGLKSFPGKLNAAVAQTIDFYVPQVEAYARTNAPWTDRTGNARSGLRSVAEHNGDTSHSIILSHSVPYGIWLEVRWDGKFAIINPTINVMGRKLMVTFRKLMQRMPR